LSSLVTVAIVAVLVAILIAGFFITVIAITITGLVGLSPVFDSFLGARKGFGWRSSDVRV
jgi:hypothetical protein